jgi:hypothetical protein
MYSSFLISSGGVRSSNSRRGGEGTIRDQGFIHRKCGVDDRWRRRLMDWSSIFAEQIIKQRRRDIQVAESISSLHDEDLL